MKYAIITDARNSPQVWQTERQKWWQLAK